MNIGFAGSRDFPDLGLVRKYVLNNLTSSDIVISGGARGVDRVAEDTALGADIGVLSFRPMNVDPGDRKPWVIERLAISELDVQPAYFYPERYSSFAAAAFVRNTYIVEASDRLVIFWDGHSHGTKDTLHKAQQKLGVAGVELIRVDEAYKRMGV